MTPTIISRVKNAALEENAKRQRKMRNGKRMRAMCNITFSRLALDLQ